MKVVLNESQIRILTEDRTNYLRQTYVNNKKIDQSVFEQILESDPTKNKEFSEWLIKIWLDGELKLEDLYKATEYLTTYYKIRNKLSGDDKNIYATSTSQEPYTDNYQGKSTTKYREKKTLKIGSLQELFKIIKPHQDQGNDLTTNEKLEKETLVGETPDWKIYIPKTYEQSCILGSGTEWCTATGKTDQYYKHYTTGDYADDLIIFVNKKNKKEKYQLHIFSAQFMDTEDNAVDMDVFFPNHLDLAIWLMDNEKLKGTQGYSIIFNDSTGTLFSRYESKIKKDLEGDYVSVRKFLIDNAYKSNAIFLFCLEQGLFKHQYETDDDYKSKLLNNLINREFVLSAEVKKYLSEIFGDLRVSKIYEIDYTFFYVNKYFDVYRSKRTYHPGDKFIKNLEPDLWRLSEDKVFLNFLSEIGLKILKGSKYLKVMGENEFFPRYFYDKSLKKFVASYMFSTNNGSESIFVIARDQKENVETIKQNLIDSNLLDKYELDGITKYKFSNTFLVGAGRR